MVIVVPLEIVQVNELLAIVWLLVVDQIMGPTTNTCLIF